MPLVNPPPTFAPIVVETEQETFAFNPVWLKWFLDLTNVISAAGGSSITHNLTSGLQGGASGDYFHLTEVQVKRMKSNQVLTWLSM